jgi:hypothetical protein
MTSRWVTGVKWTGTVLCLIGIGLTSFNVYPLNLVFGFIGSLLWAWAGLVQRDYPLLLVEGVAVVLYGAGLWSLVVLVPVAKFFLVMCLFVVYLIYRGIRDENKG